MRHQFTEAAEEVEVGRFRGFYSLYAFIFGFFFISPTFIVSECSPYSCQA